MRTPVRLLALSAALALAATRAPAQQAAPRLMPYMALAAGTQNLPHQFLGCSPETQLAGEMRAGVRYGALALEARGSAVAEVTQEDCAIDVMPDIARLPDGVFPSRKYDFSSERAATALDVRLRFGGTRRIPVVLAAGAGRLGGPGVPYLLASAGFRTAGRVHFALDVEADWYRVGYEDRMLELANGQVVRTVSSESRKAWWRGTGIRAGMELDLR